MNTTNDLSICDFKEDACRVYVEGDNNKPVV